MAAQPQPKHSETHTVVERIDELTAYRYLETAFGTAGAKNRNVSQLTVHEYADAMRRGEWLPTNQGIGFDWNGVLRDGQHRLWAIIEAKVVVAMNVTRGMDPAAFDVIDVGRRRSMSDVLTIAGEVNTHRLQGALTWQFLWDEGIVQRGTVSRDRRPTHPQRLAVLARHPMLRQSVSIATAIPSQYRRMLPPGLVIWLHYQLDQADREKATFFFERLIDGVFGDPEDPIHLLRERLLTDIGNRHGLTPIEQAALVIKAWGLFMTGQKRRLLTWKTNEAFPEIVGSGKDDEGKDGWRA